MKTKAKSIQKPSFHEFRRAIYGVSDRMFYLLRTVEEVGELVRRGLSELKQGEPKIAEGWLEQASAKVANIDLYRFPAVPPQPSYQPPPCDHRFTHQHPVCENVRVCDQCSKMRREGTKTWKVAKPKGAPRGKGLF